jgi:hypothetical protein
MGGVSPPSAAGGRRYSQPEAGGTPHPNDFNFGQIFSTGCLSPRQMK